MKIKVQIYETPSGKHPFLDWLKKFDTGVRAIIKNRIDRVESGNFGNCKPLVGVTDMWEIVIDFGPGYRIYYGLENNKMIDHIRFNMLITILSGGKKDDQDRDIRKFERYWTEYKGETHD